MKEKKHIDRLFQEGFKDFEVTPNDSVWKNIEAKLNQKKKKQRVIPIWWRYAGVAAILLLLFTVGSVYYFKDTTHTPVNSIGNSKGNSPKVPVQENSSSDYTETTNSSTLKNNNNSKNNTKSSDASQQTSGSFQSSIANKNTSKESNIKTNSASKEKQPQIIKRQPFVNTENAIANKTENIENSTLEKTQTASEATTNTNAVNNSNKKNTSAIADNNSNDKKSLIDTTTENNTITIEEAIAETNKEDKETNTNKWTIATNAAPVYFNTLGAGSSLDPQFNNNTKNGDVTLSYGVRASYAINKKLKIRSGINKVNLGYNTDDVVVFQSLTARSSNSIKNISPDNTSENLSLISGENLIAQSDDSFIDSSNSSINQSLDYIEIPLEIELALIDKKFGFNVIGGFSSFILNNNKLYSDFEGERTYIGEATNINKISYSANFGLGLSYKLTKKLDLNLEPLFKYQINTFNNTSGNFKPYFIGVYTGIGFKF